MISTFWLVSSVDDKLLLEGSSPDWAFFAAFLARFCSIRSFSLLVAYGKASGLRKMDLEPSAVCLKLSFGKCLAHTTSDRFTGSSINSNRFQIRCRSGSIVSFGNGCSEMLSARFTSQPGAQHLNCSPTVLRRIVFAIGLPAAGLVSDWFLVDILVQLCSIID